MEKLPVIRPDVVLVDIALPGISGVQLVRSRAADRPKTQFMMLTALEDSEHVFESLRAGATGYLLKRDVFEKLFSSIITLHGGGSPMTNSVARMVTLEFRDSPTTRRFFASSLNARRRFCVASRQGGLTKRLPKNSQLSLRRSNPTFTISTKRFT